MRTSSNEPPDPDRAETTSRLVARLRDGVGPHERETLVLDLVEANIPVARRIARTYDGRGCASEDLEQTAYVALVGAAQRFDASQGHDFLTYAVPCITGEVKRHFRDHGWFVRPPRPVQELQGRVDQERLRPEASGRPPSDHAVAARLDVPVRAVRQAMLARGCFTPTSLDRPLAGTVGVGLADTLADGRSVLDFDAVEARAVLGPALSTLDSLDRRLLQLSFVEERTQREIGGELGVSQSQVSRMVRDAVSRLRESVVGPGRRTHSAA